MPEITFEEIKKNIENYNTGIYFIYGEENYFIDCLFKLIKKKYKNIDVFYGNECEIEDILQTEAYQQQIFSDERIIIIKNTELNKFICDKKNENKIKTIVNSFKANIILLLVYNKNITKTSTILNPFGNCFIYNSKKIPSYKVKTFIKNFCFENNIEINDSEIDKIYNYYGDNITLITSELKNHNINNIIFAKDFNSFEFLTYITQKNIDKLILTINNFQNKNKYDLIPFFGLLYNNILKQLCELYKSNKNLSESKLSNNSDLNNQKIKNLLHILETIQYCDNWLKGVNSLINDHKYILKYLIGEIIDKY